MAEFESKHTCLCQLNKTHKTGKPSKPLYDRKSRKFWNYVCEDCEELSKKIMAETGMELVDADGISHVGESPMERFEKFLASQSVHKDWPKIRWTVDHKSCTGIGRAAYIVKLEDDSILFVFDERQNFLGVVNYKE